MAPSTRSSTSARRQTKQFAAEEDQPRIDDAVSGGNEGARVVRKKRKESSPSSSGGGGDGVKDGKSKEERKGRKETADEEPPAKAAKLESSDPHTTQVEHELVKEEPVIEYGRIHFLFKPKVETEHPKSVDDVQRLHIILQPHAKSRPDQTVKNRLLHLGRKTLPGGDGGGKKQPFWAFVAEVEDDVQKLHGRLEEESHETKTRGTRTTPADRFIASGPYVIVSQPASGNKDSGRRTTTLVYSITLPKQPGEVQKAFGITDRGAFVLSVKNPQKGDPPVAGLKEKAKYSDELQSRMGDLRWSSCDPPSYLDYPNAELLFISAHHDAGGQQVEHELNDLADEQHVKETTDRKIEGEIEQRLFAMLKAQDDEHVVTGGEQALIKGEWE